VELEREWKKSRLVPDVALIDDMLDGRDSGFDIACWLLEELPPSFTLQKRLILLTGNSDPDRVEQIRAKGFRLIQKPMRAGQLEALLGHLAPR
jgi:CheY-like chemotaxis protein